MKKRFTNILLYTCLVTTPIGIWMRTQGFAGGLTFFSLGLFGVFVYLIARFIKTLVAKNSSRFSLCFLITLSSIAITLFTKYLYHSFWDYLGLATFLVFLILLFVYLTNREQTKDHRLLSTIVMLCLISLPLVGIPSLYQGPRRLIPKEWYNRYDIEGRQSLSLPWLIESADALSCSERAWGLKKTGKTSEAIEVYNHCLTLERNPRFYFDLSELYANNNNLEMAIQMMDSTLQIDPTVPAAFNNRGLLFYKLKQNKKAIKDYEKAISLDSTISILYANIGLALYFEDRFQEACENFKIAEDKGFALNEYMRRIIRIKCD